LEKGTTAAERGVVKEDVEEKISASGRGYTSICMKGTTAAERRVVKEDVEEKISASGRGYTSIWQQDLQKTENNERTLCRPPFNWRTALDDDDESDRPLL